MFHKFKKARLEKALVKANFFHNCPRAATRVELVRFAFNHLTRKPQTSTQLFTKWDGHFRALVFVEITVMQWMVENHFAKCKTVDSVNYYYA